MNGFNWEFALKRAESEKIRQEKRKIISSPEEHKLWHANEVREFATNGRFTEVTKRIKDEHKKHVEQALLKREKIGKGKR